jgi:hypothetical protein
MEHLIRPEDGTVGRKRLKGELPDCMKCPKVKDAGALTPDLSYIRTLFFACHDIQGNQVGWPFAGDVGSMPSDVIFGFVMLKNWMAKRTEQDAKRVGSKAGSEARRK